jgi:hypothetical protein
MFMGYYVYMNINIEMILIWYYRDSYLLFQMIPIGIRVIICLYFIKNISGGLYKRVYYLESVGIVTVTLLQRGCSLRPGIQHNAVSMMPRTWSKMECQFISTINTIQGLSFAAQNVQNDGDPDTYCQQLDNPKCELEKKVFDIMGEGAQPA